MKRDILQELFEAQAALNTRYQRFVDLNSLDARIVRVKINELEYAAFLWPDIPRDLVKRYAGRSF